MTATVLALEERSWACPRAPPTRLRPTILVRPALALTWTTGDKDGIGTSLGRTSKVWYTLTDGTMSETYYPAADTPNVRDLGFVVSDGSTSSQRETDGTTQRVKLADPTSLTYRQITTDDGGRWRITKTYVTDPERPTVVMDVSSSRSPESRSRCTPSTTRHWRARRPATRKRHRGCPPRPRHPPDGPAGRECAGRSTGFAATSTGYAGSSDGWTDLADDHDLDATYDSAGPGNIVQTGEIPTDGAQTPSPLRWASDPTPRPPRAAADGSLGTRSTPSPRLTSRSGRATSPDSHRHPTGLAGDLATQYNVSLMTVRPTRTRPSRGRSSRR